MTYPRFNALESSIPLELLESRDAEISQILLGRVEGGAPSPWESLRRALEDVDPRDDVAVAGLMRRHLVLDRRTACDPAIWRYGTVFHLRNYVFDRWAKGGVVKMERLMGGVRRNAAARLWWIVETLEADAAEADGLSGWVLGSTERIKLQFNDFNSFHGRPWFARFVAALLRDSGRRSDQAVDEVFKALGRLSNVLAFDRFELSTDELRGLVEDELRSSS